MKNLQETVDIVVLLVEKMTKLETDDVEGEDNADEIATNFVTESPFRSRNQIGIDLMKRCWKNPYEKKTRCSTTKRSLRKLSSALRTL